VRKLILSAEIQIIKKPLLIRPMQGDRDSSDLKQFIKFRPQCRRDCQYVEIFFFYVILILK